MRLGLVKYVGGKMGAFEAKRGEEPRLWHASRSRPNEPAQQQRWLPEKEARSYVKLPDFVLVRWGRDAAQRKKVSDPRPEAVPISVLLRAKQEVAKVAADLARKRKEAPYLLSTSGTVHARGCGHEPTNPQGVFYSLEGAACHPQFKKWHSCIEDTPPQAKELHSSMEGA